MNSREKILINNIYERIQRIAGLLQTYKMARQFQSDVASDLRDLKTETDGMSEEIRLLTNENERRQREVK